MQKDTLTNELLKKNFKNNFELANYLISVAHHLIKAGHEFDLDAMLKDVAKNPNYYRLEDLEALEKIE
jgi:hypothetical protein